MELVMQHCSGR